MTFLNIFNRIQVMKKLNNKKKFVPQPKIPKTAPRDDLYEPPPRHLPRRPGRPKKDIPRKI